MFFYISDKINLMFGFCKLSQPFEISQIFNRKKYIKFSAICVIALQRERDPNSNTGSAIPWLCDLVRVTQSLRLTLTFSRYSINCNSLVSVVITVFVSVKVNCRWQKPSISSTMVFMQKISSLQIPRRGDGSGDRDTTQQLLKLLLLFPWLLPKTYESESDSHKLLKTFISAPVLSRRNSSKNWPLPSLFLNHIQVCLIGRAHLASRTRASKESEKLVFNSQVPVAQ